MRYLVNAAGIPNYGDEFIALAWLRYLQHHRPHDEVVLDCLDPGRADKLIRTRIGELPVRFADAMWALTRDVPEGERAYPVLRERVRPLARELFAEERPEAIHLLGGGYLNAMWPQNAALVAAAAEAGRAHGIPVYGTGLGLMPADASPEFREDLRSFRYVESRDAAGARELGIRKGLDDAFLGVRALVPWEDAPRIVVELQGDMIDDAAREIYRARIDELLAREGAATGAGVAFLEAFPPHDAALWPELCEAYPEARFIDFWELWERGQSGAPGQIWLTTRFHAHLLAAATGAAGIAIDIRGDYYGVKHRSLTALGTGWPVVRLDDPAPLPPARTSPLFRRTSQLRAVRKRLLAGRLHPPAR
ncbi:MAG: hypothetical protein EAS51_07445 [Microbacteriaceae bacterium]|nr:MAG: hypothetical protein EAS51_07445 [Microbacteriaceae bacterium]